MLYIFKYYVNSYYGLGSLILNVRFMVIDVVNFVKFYIDFFKYDNDKDGIVEILVIIYVG